jgi:hypothetical protein
MAGNKSKKHSKRAEKAIKRLLILSSVNFINPIQYFTTISWSTYSPLHNQNSFKITNTKNEI